MQKKVKLPYGIGHFPTLIYNNYVYIDKTNYIEVMEDLSTLYHFFLRPRRFGKSLWVSVLSYYYDVNESQNFQKLFGNLYIGKNPTPNKNNYWVLNFEFSRIDTQTYPNTYNGFLQRVKEGILNFMRKYEFSEIEIDKMNKIKEPSEALVFLFTICKHLKNKYPIYVIIDEYDHFANEILAFNRGDFSSMVGRNGFVRKFYEVIKTGAMEGVVGRFFATGVTPITLDSLTSGFNISTDLSRDIAFNECIGFNFEEVKHLVDLVCVDKSCDKEKMFEDMKNWYNGYIFDIDANNRVYNSDMVLYFLNQLQIQNKYPKNLLDTNIASDYGKVSKLFRLGNYESNLNTLRDLMKTGKLIAKIVRQFNFEIDFDKDSFISLLYYMGFLTLKESRGTNLSLKIPNYVIENLYYQFCIRQIEKDNQISLENFTNAMDEMAFEGNVNYLLLEIQKIMKVLSNRDALNFDEKHAKIAIVSLLHLSDLYYIKSEYEINKKYIDILLLKRPPIEVTYQYAIELKYLPKKEKKQKEQVKKEAIEQLQNYLQNEQLQKLENLKAFVLIFVGDEYEKIDVL